MPHAQELSALNWSPQSLWNHFHGSTPLRKPSGLVIFLIFFLHQNLPFPCPIFVNIPEGHKLLLLDYICISQGPTKGDLIPDKQQRQRNPGIMGPLRGQFQSRWFLWNPQYPVQGLTCSLWGLAFPVCRN